MRLKSNITVFAANRRAVFYNPIIDIEPFNIFDSLCSTRILYDKIHSITNRNTKRTEVFLQLDYSWLEIGADIVSEIKKEEETMYFSRVITGRIDPGKRDEAFALFMDDIIPSAREQEGFRGANLFTNPKTGQFITTFIWKTEEDMISSEKRGYLQEQLGKVAHYFTEPPVIAHYDVLY